MFVSIYDQSHTVILSIKDVVFDKARHAFLGCVEQMNMAPELKALLLELEDLVENQCFVRVDEVQAKIDAFDLIAVLQDGTSLKIKDLYLSSDGGVSFRSVEPKCVLRTQFHSVPFPEVGRFGEGVLRC